MAEHFLSDLTIREARPPYRHRPSWRSYVWTLPAGLCFGAGAHALFEMEIRTGFGFLIAGALIAWAFSKVVVE